MQFQRKALPAGPRMESIDLIERGRSPAPSPCPHPLPPHAPSFANEGHGLLGIASIPLAKELCSVLITSPAFGLGSDIRRGPRRGRGAFGELPARALGRGGRTGGECGGSSPTRL